MNYTIAPSGFVRVKELAEGRWSAILGDLYPELAPALRMPGKSRCACPIHGSAKGNKGDGFRLFDDFHKTGGGVCNTCGEFATGIDLICFLENRLGDPKHALHILERYFGLDTRSNVAPRMLPKPIHVPLEKDDPEAATKRRSLLSRIWAESMPLSDLPDDHQAIRYLSVTRGVADLAIIKKQTNMRFHPDLFYARSDIEDHPPLKFPGLISMMHNASGRAVGLHRIFLDLTEPAKAPVESAKKILRTLEETLNGAVRINGRAGFTQHANVCEGIETGMAIAHATGHSVYAAGYATLLASWTPPEGTKFVTIWCDRDANKAGINHAILLKERMEEVGLACRILVPCHLSSDSEDWNDVLLDVGFEAVANAYSGSSDLTESL